MTREEIISALQHMLIVNAAVEKPAIDMAVRSLEMWDEVMKDVQDWQDDFNTHVECLRITDVEKEETMLYGEDVVNIIGNHMAELKEVES